MGGGNMSIKSTLKNKEGKRGFSLPIKKDIGWTGPKPAATRADKIKQIKTLFIADMPLLIEGANVTDFKEYPQVPAQISIMELQQYVANFKKKEGRSFIVVQELDSLPVAEQLKFVTLLKDKRIFDCSLPDEVQILLPVQSGMSVSSEIRDLSYYIRV